MQAPKIRQKSPSGHHRTTLSGYIFATKAHIDNRKKTCYAAICAPDVPHNMVNSGPLPAEIGPVVWGTPANFNGFRVLTALLHGSQVVSVSHTLRRWTEGATYVRQGDHHVGHWPTFLVCFSLRNLIYVVWTINTGIDYCFEYLSVILFSYLKKLNFYFNSALVVWWYYWSFKRLLCKVIWFSYKDVSFIYRASCAPFLGELGPHLTQCDRGRALPSCQVSSWSIPPFGHNISSLQTGRTDSQDRQDRQNNGPIE